MTARRFLIFPFAVALLLFSLACERTITQVVESESEPSNCFECHSDDNTILVANEKQWSNSFHASGRTTSRNRPPCSGCHTSEGFKDRMAGVGAGDYPNATVIHCFTCHAPHSTGDFGLRVTTAQSLENGVSEDIRSGNICAACHHGRRDVNTYISDPENISSSHWGPHRGPQADNLFGSNGYEYSWYNYEDTEAHRKVTQNGCLDCHYKFTQNFVVGGHSFNMRAILATEFEDESGHREFTEILNTDACEPCHGDLDDFNHDNIQDDVHALLDSLGTILFNAGLIGDDLHPIRGNVVSADTAGALWNFLVVEEDRSFGVHNPNYILGLLESAIMYMEGNYPQPSPPVGSASAPLARRKR